MVCSRRLALLILAGATLFSLVDSSAPGAITLDNYTFDKMMAVPGATWLVKVDKNYAYGEKEDAFKELCKLGHSVPNFFIGEIGVQEYGDKDNEELAKTLGVKTEAFPTFFLIKGNDVEARIKFEGFPDPKAVKPTTWDDDEDGAWEAPMLKDVTADNLNLWLKRNGVKMPAIGTIAELDELVKSFMKDGMKDADLAEAKKLAEGDFKNDKKAPIYVKIMEKVKSKGAEYVQQELTRVKKIMSGKITPEKQAEMSDKVKILNIFADTQ